MEPAVSSIAWSVPRRARRTWMWMGPSVTGGVRVRGGKS